MNILKILNEQYTRALEEWEDVKNNSLEDDDFNEFDCFEFGEVRAIEMLAIELDYDYIESKKIIYSK